MSKRTNHSHYYELNTESGGNDEVNKRIRIPQGAERFSAMAVWDQTPNRVPDLYLRTNETIVRILQSPMTSGTSYQFDLYSENEIEIVYQADPTNLTTFEWYITFLQR